MVDLSTEFAGIRLKNPVITASGTFGYGEEFSQLIDLNQLGGLVVKGLSIAPMQGAVPPRLHETAAGMLNAIGLQNMGVERFLAEKWPIERVPLKSRAALARCFMPWYIGPKGEEIAYDAPKAVPMSLTDVPKAMAILHEERQADIQQFVKKFHGKKGVVKFRAPTYALPGEQYFILDRNHRLSALTLNSVRFEVTLWNVRGPLDPSCLLDLIHWTPPRKP